jgi:SSS family solute:Na+ symporter
MSTSLSIVDWIFIIAFLIMSCIIGILARRKISSLSDFLVAGRKLRSLWGLATLSSTEMGLVTIIYYSEEAYQNGFVAITAGVIAAITMWIVGKTGFIIDRLREYQVMTVPEYFEIRFNSHIRWVAGVLTFLTGVLNMGIFLQVEGHFLVIVMGLSPSLLPLVMGSILVIVVAYTMSGGMVSVVLTDIFQFVLILIGITVTTVIALNHSGGFSGLITAVHEHYGNEGFLPFAAPRYGMLFILWTCMYYLSGWTSWQPVVQRVLSMESVSTARKLYRISSIFMFFRACIPMIWGIAALAVLGIVSETSTILPTMISQIVPTGLIGLTLIGFLSASMSTYDSYLLSFSSILAQDIVSPWIKHPLTSKSRVLIIRIGIIIIGLFIFTWGVFYEFSESVFRYITLTGSLSYAGIVTALVGGIYWKRVSTNGVYCAFAGSAILPLICLFIPSINSTYAGMTSFVLAPVGLIVGSLIWKRKEKSGDK